MIEFYSAGTPAARFHKASPRQTDSPFTMTTRTKKIIAATIAVIILVFLGALIALQWYVKSGRLQALIEARAGEAIGADVRMKSLRLSWPLNVDIEDLEVSIRGPDEPPLLTCPRLRIGATPWSIMSGRLDSLVMIGARINIVDNERGELSLPDFSADKEGGKPLSIKTIKVINAQINIDTQTVKASLRGILATLREPFLSTGNEKIARLDIDAAEATIGGESEERIPVTLKLVRSKFAFREKPLTSEIEGEVNLLLTAELPYLTLPPGTPVGVSFEFDYFKEKDSLENGMFSFEIEPFSNMSVYGSVAGLTSGTPIPSLNMTIEAPEIASLTEYIELFQRPNYEDMELSGNLKITGEMTGSLKNPKLSLRAGAKGGRFEWKGLVLEGLDAEMPVAIEAGGVRIGPGRMSANKAIVPAGGEENLKMASLSGILSADASSVSVTGAKAKLGDAIELSGRGDYDFESGLFRGDLRMDEAPVAEALAVVPFAVGKLPDNLSVGGNLKLDFDIGAKLGSGLERVEMKWDASLKKGEFSSGEFMAAAGVDAKMTGRVESESPKELWKFELRGDVGNFEILVDTFYKDFSKNLFPFSFSGEYSLSAKHIRNAAASLGLGPIGDVAARGEVQIVSAPRIDVEMSLEKIELAEFFKEMGGDLLSEMWPAFGDADVGGVASGDFTVRLEESLWDVAGAIDLDGGRLALNESNFAADSVSVHLPFDIHFPQEEPSEAVSFALEDYGAVKVGSLSMGPVSLGSLDLAVALKENALSVKAPSPLEIFGGEVNIGDITGESLLGPSARLTTSLSVEDVDLGRASEELGLPGVEGTFGAQFSEITLTADSLSARGTARATVFGGKIDMTSLRIEKPLSSVRTIGADFEFEEIDLLTVTEVLEFGSISGIMEGTLKGLEISQGQAAAFVADFQTVKRGGVRQRINFDAVQNITILGTGYGFQAGLGRGFASFFEEFGYDTIGFYCTLKNDNFMMKGKVVRGDTEYFVKGVRIGPQINVINRNPGQTVSFKSMVQRINRIKKK